MRALNPIALLLVIVGALNWGLVGLFEFDRARGLDDVRDSIDAAFGVSRI